MAELRQFEFRLLRYFPDAVKGEFVNIGLMLTEAHGSGFADIRMTRSWRRLLCSDPQADVEMIEGLGRELRARLAAQQGPMELTRWLEDSFSNLVQLSESKGCMVADPVAELATMAKMYLEEHKIHVVHEKSDREQIRRTMEDEFRKQGLWGMVMADFPAEPYTKPGDPFKLDFSYRVKNAPVDEIKLFHAVSLKNSVEAAWTLAYRYPRIQEGVIRVAHANPILTAVVDEHLDRGQVEIQLALGAMEENQIRIASVAEMPAIAEAARVELKA